MQFRDEGLEEYILRLKEKELGVSYLFSEDLQQLCMQQPQNSALYLNLEKCMTRLGKRLFTDTIFFIEQVLYHIPDDAGLLSKVVELCAQGCSCPIPLQSFITVYIQLTNWVGTPAFSRLLQEELMELVVSYYYMREYFKLDPEGAKEVARQYNVKRNILRVKKSESYKLHHSDTMLRLILSRVTEKSHQYKFL